MARINIDDELHADHRFKRLVRILGKEDEAVGMVYRWWRLAQRHWGNEMALVPDDEFEFEGFKPIAESKLAERRDSGWYAPGAEERFAWYLQKCRASKAGVEARQHPKNDTGEKKPKNRKKPAKNRNSGSGQPEDTSRSTGDSVSDNPPAPVPVPAPVPAPVTVPVTVPKNMGAAPPTFRIGKSEVMLTEAQMAPGQRTAAFLTAYADAYKLRHGVNPESLTDGLTIGKINAWLNKLSLDRAVSLIQVYCQMDGERGWFVTRNHDLLTFLQNLNAVGNALAKGQEGSKPKSTLDEMREMGMGGTGDRRDFCLAD